MRTQARFPGGRCLSWLMVCAAVVGSVFGADVPGKISNTKGADAPVVLGVITGVAGKVLTVTVPGLHEKQTIERTITITENTAISYLDIADSAKRIPTVGYHIKGLAEDDRRLLKSAILSPPIGPPIALGPGRLTLSAEQLFAKADLDGNGKVSYCEFSRTIELSPKHGPNDFQAADKNTDSQLDLPEFIQRIQSVTWWRLSRKTAKEFFVQCDQDANGALSLREFSTIGAGHLDAVFPRCDKDKSGGLDLQEVTDYITKMTGD